MRNSVSFGGMLAIGMPQKLQTFDYASVLIPADDSRRDRRSCRLRGVNEDRPRFALSGIRVAENVVWRQKSPS